MLFDKKRPRKIVSNQFIVRNEIILDNKLRIKEREREREREREETSNPKLQFRDDFLVTLTNKALKTESELAKNNFIMSVSVKRDEMFDDGRV